MSKIIVAESLISGTSAPHILHVSVIAMLLLLSAGIEMYGVRVASIFLRVVPNFIEK